MRARKEILELLSEQDRAVLVADADAYLETLTPDDTLARRSRELLSIPFTAYRQEVVRLDVTDDGLSAEGAQKLRERRPHTLGQAGRIDGVRAADVALLLVHLERWRREGRAARHPSVEVSP